MMRLLLSTLPSARRLVPTGHGVVTVTFFGLLVGLEILGRAATSDLHDGLAALVLAWRRDWHWRAAVISDH